jgi:hypothetical protein
MDVHGRQQSEGIRVSPTAFRRYDPEAPFVSGLASRITEGRAWLERLPALVAECAERWSLSLERPFPYAYASLALPSALPDGSSAVLKTSRESNLRTWFLEGRRPKRCACPEPSKRQRTKSTLLSAVALLFGR